MVDLRVNWVVSAGMADNAKMNMSKIRKLGG